nr:GntR family transcriptional regulator [uncultured Cohaesibacter sp.]
MKSIVRPKSLTELVAEKLMDVIVNGELELGAQVSEARIAKDFNVSRTPVREAFNRLEMEGLLSVEPQRGTFVFSLQPHELAQLCDARVCLETTALELAIKCNAEALSERLASCVEKMTQALDSGDANRYLALDTEFHQHLFDCSKNRFLNDAYQAIAIKMAALRNRLSRHAEHMNKSYLEHQAITEAVKSKDTEKALDILRNHIDRKEGSYWKQATKTT